MRRVGVVGHVTGPSWLMQLNDFIVLPKKYSLLFGVFWQVVLSHRILSSFIPLSRFYRKSHTLITYLKQHINDDFNDKNFLVYDLTTYLTVLKEKYRKYGSTFLRRSLNFRNTNKQRKIISYVTTLCETCQIKLKIVITNYNQNNLWYYVYETFSKVTPKLPFIIITLVLQKAFLT